MARDALRSIQQMAADATAGRRLAGNVYARSALAKGAFVSKVLHTFSVQAPSQATREDVIATRRPRDAPM